MSTQEIASKLRALAGRNGHIHTTYSACAAPEMTLVRVLAEADRVGLQSIALTDHHHPGDADIRPHLAGLAAQLERIPHRVEVVIGAEMSAFGVGRYAESLSEIRDIAFRLYACNHYHMPGWEHPEPRNAVAYKEHSMAVLRAIIPTGRAHCIPHPLLGRYLTSYLDDVCAMTRLIGDDDLEELFVLARRHGVAWEVSVKHLIKDVPFARRYLAVGFTVGADFRLGTDAHTLGEIDPRPMLDNLIRALEEPVN